MTGHFDKGKWVEGTKEQWDNVMAYISRVHRMGPDEEYVPLHETADWYHS